MSQAQSLKPTMDDLPKDKPLIFTNLLRFHTEARYADPPASQPEPSPASGSTVYWNRYFPTYHKACLETLGSSSSSLQKVMYKGAPLVPLVPSKRSDGEEEGYWHGVVVTRVENWEVAERVSENEEYKIVGRWHRDAAVEDEALFVSCAVDGFEMEALEKAD